MPDKLEIVVEDFSTVTNLCIASFLKVYDLRGAIQEPRPLAKEDVKALAILFKEGIKASKSNVFDTHIFTEYQEKISDFFTANEFPRGKMLSKGTIDFFEYAISNPEDYSMLQTYLSRVEKQMVTSWYGILQKYGKLTISMSKRAYPT
jgi:hypothetical protein